MAVNHPARLNLIVPSAGQRTESR